MKVQWRLIDIDSQEIIATMGESFQIDNEKLKQKILEQYKGNSKNAVFVDYISSPHSEKMGVEKTVMSWMRNKFGPSMAEGIFIILAGIIFWLLLLTPPFEHKGIFLCVGAIGIVSYFAHVITETLIRLFKNRKD